MASASSPGSSGAAFAADHPRLTAAYLAEQERLGCIRPAWRFAAVDTAGRCGSRVVWWGPPGADAPMLIDVVFDPGDRAAGDVLAAAIAALGLDDTEVDYVTDREPGAGRAIATEPIALEAAGFALIATQVRLAHAAPIAAPAVPDTVALATATDAAMVALIGMAATGSGDRGTRDRDPAGELRMLRGMPHDPAWWQVATDRATGAALGFVAPALTGDGGHVIAFIGVAPAARARGLGRLLLAAGTAALRVAAPEARIIADVDDTNTPMLRAAAATGYVAFGARAHYRRPPLPPATAVVLREIRPETVRTICELATRPDQRRFVATNAESLAQALFAPHAWYRAIYAGSIPVGFAMLDLVPDQTPYLWRFMIDRRYQGRGYGQAALAQVIAHVRAIGGAAIELGVVRADGSAEAFYARAGFVLTGAIEDDEAVMRLALV